MKKKSKNVSFKWLENTKIYQILIDRFVGYKENYTEEDLKKNLYMEILNL